MKRGKKQVSLRVGCILLGLLVVVIGWLTPRWPLGVNNPWLEAEKKLLVIAEDLRNGGILGVVMGVQEASQSLHWQLQVFDVGSDDARREQVLQQGLALHPDGVILVGSNVLSPAYKALDQFQQRHIPMVGWHVAPYPGAIPDSPVLLNVTTDSRAVAQAAAALVQPGANQSAGVVVFTDGRINIAMEKANQMVEALKACDRCAVLAVEDIPLDQTATLMPSVIRRLNERYGEQWTHSLAINDLYFDHAIYELLVGQFTPPHNISAGDGSPSALLRIKYQSFQAASVAEPLLMHGWQLVDELRKSFLGQPPSGYVNPPYVVTQANVARLTDANGFFEPDYDYRAQYLKDWQGK